MRIRTENAADKRQFETQGDASCRVSKVTQVPIGFMIAMEMVEFFTDSLQQ